jgi:hypothetical protein
MKTVSEKDWAELNEEVRNLRDCGRLSQLRFRVNGSEFWLCQHTANSPGSAPKGIVLADISQRTFVEIPPDKLIETLADLFRDQTVTPSGR